jgi:hypothetical protein
MKKLLLTALLCLILSANAHAAVFIFDAEGVVNPNFNGVDSDPLSGIARYYFYFDPTVNVSNLGLQFEGDVFDLGLLDSSDFTIVAPAGWSFTLDSGTDLKGLVLENLNTQGSSTNDPIIVDVNYVLNGEPSTLHWNEGQVWSQKYTMLGTRGQDIGISGGSTTPVPEPATMSMLGLGILGLVGAKLRRKS